MKTTILTLALALAFSFAAVPADAGLSNADKCEVFRAKTEMNFAKCLKVANLLEAKGKTGDRAKCVTKFDQGIAKAKTKFVNDKLNVTEAECSLNQEAVDAIKALDLVAAGVALADYGLDSGDLPLSQDIQDLIDDAVAGVDITSDNQAVCEAADGTWDAETSTCTAPYNCFIGGYCSQAATEFPSLLSFYTNVYEGHNRVTTDGSGASCATASGLEQAWVFGRDAMLEPSPSRAEVTGCLNNDSEANCASNLALVCASN